jgi:hypothetical protein
MIISEENRAEKGKIKAPASIAIGVYAFVLPELISEMGVIN